MIPRLQSCFKDYDITFSVLITSATTEMDTMLLRRESGGGLDTFQFYYFHPSLAAAAIFVAIFAITTIVHSWQMFRTKTWFLIPFLIGGFCKFFNSHQHLRLPERGLTHRQSR